MENSDVRLHEESCAGEKCQQHEAHVGEEVLKLVFAAVFDYVQLFHKNPGERIRRRCRVFLGNQKANFVPPLNK